jgi:hypothetical protein
LGDFTFDVITHFAKVIHVIGFRGVGKTVMEAFPLSEPDGAFLGGGIANCDNEVEVRVSEFIRLLRATLVPDADFPECFERFGVDIARRLRPCADRFPLVSHTGVDDGLGQLRAARVAGAEEKDFTFLVHRLIILPAYCIASMMSGIPPTMPTATRSTRP